MKKEIIVPFFISHQGCPHRCVFCDQTAITGAGESIPTSASIVERVDAYRASSGNGPVHLAFYGGSFTLLPHGEQFRLLQVAARLKAAGKAASIRISTRPDAINGATIGLLCAMGVDVVELGVQSMDEAVLARSGRGHGRAAVVEAARLVKAAGLKMGMQLMPGLPGDDEEKALASLRGVLALAPDFMRIYPTVVIRGTVLAEMYGAGAYAPLSLDAAVELGKVMLRETYLAGLPVIRFGIPTSDLPADAVLAGPYHPALRQLAESALMYDLLSVLAGRDSNKVTVQCHPSRISDVVGQGRGNLLRLRREKGIDIEKVTGDDSVPRGNLRVVSSLGMRAGSITGAIKYKVSSTEGRSITLWPNKDSDPALFP